MRLRSNVAMVVVGMIGLGASLLARRFEPTDVAVVTIVTVCSWAGSVLVVVGLGWMLFLERD